jgi:hypothetical protein
MQRNGEGNSLRGVPGERVEPNEKPDVREMHWQRVHLKDDLYQLMAFGPATFIMGVSLTHLSDQRWPNGWRYLLTAGVALSVWSMVASYLKLRRARAAYRQAIENLRALSPEIADALKDAIK